MSPNKNELQSIIQLLRAQDLEFRLILQTTVKAEFYLYNVL